MQCPTCGNDTPGTLGKCSHCEAPIDVYSVGPALPLASPVAEAAPAGTAMGVSAGADAIGDRTMTAPPSWAAGPPEPPAQPPIQLSAEPPIRLPVEPPATASAPTPAVASPLPAHDPDDTAAWTFDPDADDDSGAFSTPASPPSWGRQAPRAAEQPAPPSPSNSFGLQDQAPRTESIVPDSWFAQPRKPEAPDTDATQAWGQQPPGGPQFPALPDAEATQIAPGAGAGLAMPGAHGFGDDLDRTRMDSGSPMGTPGPMGGIGPMGGMGNMGPGPTQTMQPGPMHQGPMGPGMQPMGAMGPGDPAYGGYPPGQFPPGGPGHPGQHKSGTSKPLIAAVAALVTVAVGAVAFVAWPSGDDAPTGGDPSPAASQTQVAQKNAIPPEMKQQAAALNAILNDSVATRRVLAGALGRAGKCKTLPQAIQGFQTVAQRRTNQMHRTQGLKVDKLANGERLRGSLNQALGASLQVDQVLLRWAQANQRKCKGKPRPSAAQVPGRADAERRATAAKKQFVVLWNPVAKKTEQPQRSWKRV
ncbi:hypothetical protein BJY14_003248 [Actinomadura luteofluorescens]|uniref:DUF5667 domain-containing protein n=1 Tax=Actinomadura luteofluorescens TaxID=46163 RepID=A0A7Y9EGD6_9ACTN|nr:hypothetical protein [Actinomadura luteofluorescens]NYD47265.1 hypothetical protein [Actinomadura luteofluorescens]